MIHKNVGKNRGEGGTHGYAFSFLIVDSIKSEESGGHASFDKVEGFRVNKFGNKVNGFWYIYL